MKGKWTITGVLGVGLLLVLTVGLVHAQGPQPPEVVQPQGETGTLAPVGTAFTYQGQLKRDGNPVNDTCDFQFSLWDMAANGTQIGETNYLKGVEIRNGLFTVPLDFGVGAFQGSARWLQIAVECAGDADYVTLSPRQPLTPVPYALALPGLWTQPNANSPNLIGGYSGNSVTSGAYGATIGGGGDSSNTNRVTDNYGTVGGGSNNQAGDNAGTTSDRPYATVGGGYGNEASGAYATVGGGYDNTASGWYGTVGGGYGNEASGDATVGGGYSNEASGAYATVGGGYNNTASYWYATVGGGNDNTASYWDATVGGGGGNTASGDYATVGGGYGNLASGVGAFVGGGGYNGHHYDGNEALGVASTIAGGYGNLITTTAIYATIGGGHLNSAVGPLATIGGGDFNSAAGGATIGGGFANSAGDTATVGGGYENMASGDEATIGGGAWNLATSDYATVPGGMMARADLYGQMAYASGRFSIVGDAQTSIYVLRNTSSATAQTELFLDGSGLRITIASGRTAVFDILVVGREDDNGESAGYWAYGVIERVGSTTAIVGTVTVLTLGEDDAAWSVTVDADDANDALRIRVQGGAGDTVRWVATVRTAEVMSP